MQGNGVAPGHIPSLDGFRAAAIVIVFLSHSGFGHVIPGTFGVTVFFFLSGFLITTLLFREAAVSGRIDVPAFFGRRVMRLTPPLLVTLALAYGAAALGVIEADPSAGVIAAQLAYVFNYHQIFAPDLGDGVPGLRVLWSLAVEEHFYLLYPALFIALSRIEAPRQQILVLAAILGLVLCWRIILVTDLGASYARSAQSTDTRLDSILWGCLLAFLHRADWLPVTRALPGWAAFGALAAGIGVLLATFLWRDETFRQTWRYTLQGAALVPIFHYAVVAPRLALFRPLNWPGTGRIALWSYAIYLSHDVILHALAQHGLGPDRPLAYNAIGAALSVAYAAAMHRYVESPLARWRRRAGRRAVAARMAATAA